MNIVTKQALMLDFLQYLTGTEEREIRECHIGTAISGTVDTEYIFVRFRNDFEAYIEALKSYSNDVLYVRLNEDIYGKDTTTGQWQKLLAWHM